MNNFVLDNYMKNIIGGYLNIFVKIYMKYSKKFLC